MTSYESAKIKRIVRKFALLNAINHKGETRIKPVLGRLFAENPHLTKKISEINSIVAEIVQQVNNLTFSEQKEIVRNTWPHLIAKKRKEAKIVSQSLPNVRKYKHIVTRFSPNPDCVLHLGSARAIILSYTFAKKYNGSFLLRFEDTDPKTKRPRLEFYDSIREDLKWLNCRWDAEYIQSNRIPIYYEYAENVIKNGHAYICTCTPKDFREKVQNMKSCSCRNLEPENNLLRWERMLDGTYREGEAVVRIKTELNHPNPAIRDWPALRVVDTRKSPHPIVGSKYRVWPLYNFSTGIDDHLMNVTHIIRGKEHLTNQKRQEYLYQHLGWQYPETVHYGRLKIEGASLSKSSILKGLETEIFKHWDDPRLATLAALRRRGITSAAIQNLMLDVGLKTADVVLSWKNLYANNRKMIDPISNRYFFVKDPKPLLVNNIPRRFMAQIPIHPDHPERGFRYFEITPTKGKASFLVSINDARIMKKGEKLRFMELFNIQIEKVKENLIQSVFHSENYEEAKKLNMSLIHWIPLNTGIPCKVVMQDASIAKGFAEASCQHLSKNDIIQFERFGFVRVDKLDKGLTAYFAHR